MGVTLILTPVLVATWPMLAASVASVAGAAGFTAAQVEKTEVKKTSVEILLDNREAIGETLHYDEQIVIQRQGVTVTFSRDARGHFKTCVEGDLSIEELQRIGEEIGGKVIQQYVYRRVMKELADNGFVTLDEEQGEDETIRLHVRRHND